MSAMNISYEGLASCWENQTYDPRLSAYKHRLYPKMNTMPTPLGENFSFIFDFHKSSIVFLSKTFTAVTGYPSHEVKFQGLNLFDIIHPADVRGAFHGYQVIWRQLNQLPQELRPQFRAALDYRFRITKGNYVRLLQEFQNFTTDNLGNIVFAAGRCSDISHWGKSIEITLIMEDPTTMQRLQIPCYRKDTGRFLSKREKEILKLLARGKSSKAVADDLAISYHTVNTHRQNMLNKMGIRKTTGLVNFAVNQGII